MTLNFNRVWASEFDRSVDYPTENQAKRGLSFLGTEAPIFELHDAIFQNEDQKAKWLYDQVRLACERFGQKVQNDDGTLISDARDTMANAITNALLTQRKADEGGYGIVRMANAEQTQAGQEYNMAVSPKHLAEFVDSYTRWANIKDKPQTATRWPDYSEVTNTPIFGSAAWRSEKDFDKAGSAKEVSDRLEALNSAAWSGINDAWGKANDAQKRVGFFEWLMGGSPDRNYWYIGDRGQKENLLLQGENGFVSVIYKNKTLFRVTPDSVIDFGTIDWTHVNNKKVVGSGDETGLVKMNGSAGIDGVSAKDYAASQYQARQAWDKAVGVQNNLDAANSAAWDGINQAWGKSDNAQKRAGALEALVRKSPDSKFVYLGSSVDQKSGAGIQNEDGWLSVIIGDSIPFQTNPSGEITRGHIDVSKVTNDFEYGDGFHKNLKTGLITQWGYASSREYRDVWVTFPRAFSTNRYVVVSIDVGPGGGSHYVSGKSTTSCNIGKNGGNSDISCQFIAIGY